MIRALEEQDMEQVMKIWLANNLESHHFIDQAYWYIYFEQVKAMIPESETYVDVEGEEVLGFVGVVDGFVAGLFVRSDKQSKGIGKKMLDYLKGKGMELKLHVYQKNKKAMQFYMRENFICERQIIDENTGEIEFVMEFRR